MYKTLKLELNNGQRDDYSETLYISINVSTHVYSFHVAWETNGDGFDYCDTGEVKGIGIQWGEVIGTTNKVDEAKWWNDFLKDTIAEIIDNQTAIDDAEEYLAGEGAWLVDFDETAFRPDRWEDHSN